ncbi:MAG: hypothetical protein IJ568_03990 [Bacilli bacterium]|nr:hypothetical protein [Bacilli bacterium]
MKKEVIEKDLKEIETQKRWIEYEPDGYIEKLHILHDDNIINKDISITYHIDNLYEYLNNLPNKKLEEVDDNIYNDLISKIPKFNIEEYAELKLSKDQKAFCKIFVDCYDFKTNMSNGVAITDIKDYYLRTYLTYLIDKQNKINKEKTLIKKKTL